MKTHILAAGLALALVAGGAASAATQPMKISKTDRKMIDACVAMPSEEMMKNDGCRLMMKKMKVSGDEMKVMAACMAMSKDAMMADKACVGFNGSHPGMMP